MPNREYTFLVTLVVVPSENDNRVSNKPTNDGLRKRRIPSATVASLVKVGITSMRFAVSSLNVPHPKQRKEVSARCKSQSKIQSNGKRVFEPMTAPLSRTTIRSTLRQNSLLLVAKMMVLVLRIFLSARWAKIELATWASTEESTSSRRTMSRFEYNAL